ncbi:MAG: TIGR02996 domain-containing protein, partial [Myxococcales bacterium]|nr:TIGR02996 domain-containing protein [Myxococcales bacterium]
MSIDTFLDRAAAAVERRDRVEALQHLLLAWRTTAHPHIAALVETLSADIDRALPAVDHALEGEAYHDAWVNLAAQQREVDVARLVPGLFRLPLGKLLAARVEHMRSRPADPRITRALFEMIAEPPATAQSLKPMWNALFAQLASSGDVRGRALLEARLDQPQGASKFWPHHYQKTRELLEVLPAAPPTLGEATARRVARLGAALTRLAEGQPSPAQALLGEGASDGGSAAGAVGGDEAAELLAQIEANPSDLSLRSVYADMLSERGDPRGELIALQLRELRGEASAADRSNGRKLLGQFGPRWLGELQPVIVPQQFGFAGGFLDWCEVVFKSPEQRALAQSAMWSTVRAVYCDDLELMRSEHLRSLERVGGFEVELFGALCSGERALPLREIGPVYLPRLPVEEDALFGAPSRALPNVEKLELVAVPYVERIERDVSWLAELRVAKTLRELSFSATAYSSTLSADWLALFALLPRLERINLEHGYDKRVSLLRHDGGYRLVVAQTASLPPHVMRYMDGWTKNFAEVLAYFLDPPPVQLRIEDAGNRPTPAEFFGKLFVRLRKLRKLDPLRGVEVQIVRSEERPLSRYETRNLGIKRLERQRKARLAYAKAEK